MSELNPFLLAANTPEPDPRLLPLLRSNSALASRQDGHGYSLLHAAASYNHAELLLSLVNEFKVDVNLVDEDNETCLFVAETVDIARVLVESLHIDVTIRNDEGMTAAEKLVSEQEFPDVAQYLGGLTSDSTSTTGDASHTRGQDFPGLPPNVSITMGSVNGTAPEDLPQEPDPDFRRRIEELASSETFHTAEGQGELRDLITDAVRDVSGDGRGVRRRVG
jgi:uncharacterized protein